jgi:nucleotide-binding universal stress UspA family protein
VRKSIHFAKTINARVRGFCVVTELPYIGCEAEIGEDIKKQVEAAVQAQVNKDLLAVEKAARESGVTCETARAKNAQPYEAIIDAVAKKGGDLVIMVCRGRREVQALLLGREIRKMLTHSKIPVLVYR